MATRTLPIPASSRSSIKGNGQPEPKPIAPKAKAAAKGSTIMVEEPRTEILSVPIVGIEPLIVHNMSKKQALEFLAVRFGKNKPARGNKTPEEEFRESRYISTKGWDGMHAGAFRAACVGAARMVDGKQMTKMKRLIFIIPDGQCAPMYIPELDLTFSPKPLVRIIGEPKMRTDFIRVDSGAPDVRFRAEYWPWSALIQIEFNANRISGEQVANLMDLAGRHEGVGEGRPSSPENATGTFGRWKVELKH